MCQNNDGRALENRKRFPKDPAWDEVSIPKRIQGIDDDDVHIAFEGLMLKPDGVSPVLQPLQ